MYDAFYGFTSEPFRLSPDAHFCFKHRSFSKAKSYFNYALHHGEGFVLVTGRPGTGKTTLIEDLLGDLANTGMMTVRVDSAQLGADDLLRRVAYAFGLDACGVDKATLLHRLEHFLHQRVRESGKALLIVDEAQTLPADALEELRLITNLTNHGQPLVQIFLVGQEALRDLISDPALEQLHQRILCACHLNPLPLKEMRDYLAHRLECAGWNGDPVIDSGAIRTLHRGSGGIPRLINKLTDRLLLHGGLEEKHELTASDAEYVLQELRSELLLKEGSLSDGGDQDPDIKIEDIRLQQPPIMPPDSEPDPAPEKPPVQPDPVDPVVSEVPDFLPPALPIDALNLVETPDQIDGHIPPVILNSAHGNGDIGSVPAFAPPQQPDGTKAPSTPAPVRDTDPAGLKKGSMPKSARKRGIWVLLTLLVLLLGGGFYLSQGGGMGSIDKVVGFWSRMHDRLRQVSGRDAPSGGETMTVVKPAVQEPIHERAEPAAPDRDIAMLSSAPKPPNPLAEEIADDEVAVPTFAPFHPPQGLAMADLAGLTSAMDSPPETTEIEPVSPTPTGTVTAPSSETDSTGSAEKPPQVTIASKPAADTELDEQAAPTGDASALETAASSPADPVEARLAGLVEETRELGIETELLGPSQVRLVLRDAVAFGFDSVRISRKSRAMLNRLSALFVEYDGLSVRIVGHTDDSGAADYNRNLSARRAAAIQRHMLSRGVSSERLSSAGQGEDEPLVPSLGEELSRDERLANRRIELWLEPIAAED